MITRISFVELDEVCSNLKNHLIPNIWTPRLIRLTENVDAATIVMRMQGPIIKLQQTLLIYHSLLRERISLGRYATFFILGQVNNYNHCVDI